MLPTLDVVSKLMSNVNPTVVSVPTIATVDAPDEPRMNERFAVIEPDPLPCTRAVTLRSMKPVA